MKASAKEAFSIYTIRMENTITNPRLQQVIEHWELKNPYESLIASLDTHKNVFHVIPGESLGDSADAEEPAQEDIPIATVVSFMNIFLNRKLTTGVDANTFQPFVYYDHRRVIGLVISIPQDIYIIYMEDEVIKGSFSEDHSRLLQSLLKVV